MNQAIADIIKGHIQNLDFVDKIAGLTSVLTFDIVTRDKDNNPTTVQKSFPIACCLTEKCNIETAYQDLMPNSEYKSVIYFEDGGVSFEKAESNWKYYKSSLRLVAWLNIEKLTESGICKSEIPCTYAAHVITEIIRTLPEFPKSHSPIERVYSEITNQLVRSPSIFSAYTYDEKHIQYLMAPYDYFALTIETSFAICLSSRVVPDSTCIPDIIPIPKTLDVLEYNGGVISNEVLWDSYDIVYVNGNITVSDGGNLIISPNINGSNSFSLGDTKIVFTGDYLIDVINSGRITVNGTETRKIYFTVDYNKDGIYGELGDIWQDITIESTGISVLNYIIVEYGRGNTSYLAGGGILIYSETVSLTNIEVRYCECPSGDGGGIFIDTLTGMTILENIYIHHCYANKGGGICLSNYNEINGLNIHDCEVNINDGIAIDCNTGVKISNGIIHDNHLGGGVDNVAVWSELGCITLENCLLFSNERAIETGYSSIFINCTIVNNNEGIKHGGTNDKLINCIIWGNAIQILQYSSEQITPEYANCAVEGGLIGVVNLINGGGDINLNISNSHLQGPRFVDPGINDYHIGNNESVLIDSGIEVYEGINAPINDLDGKERVGVVDIGVYEYL